MTDLNALAAANAKRWANAKMTRKADAVSVAARLIETKQRYQIVSSETGVPWEVIAVLHERESSQDWSRSLAQGDPWNAVSVHTPKGRGPFRSWEEAAVDALSNCAPFLIRHKDWSLPGMLTALEIYNGLGYANRGLPSAYLWAGTDQYVSGKFVRDGVYDPNKVDLQLGCAALFLAMMALDRSITFAGVRIAPSQPRVQPTSRPAAWWTALLDVILSLFRRIR